MNLTGQAAGRTQGRRKLTVARNYDETLTLRVDGRSLQLGRPAASKVWVQ